MELRLPFTFSDFIPIAASNFVCKSVYLYVYKSSFMPMYLNFYFWWHTQDAEFRKVRQTGTLKYLFSALYAFSSPYMCCIFFYPLPRLLRQIEGHHNVVVNKLQILPNEALRVINFKPPLTTATPLFKSCKILKLVNNVNLQNFVFPHRQFEQEFTIFLYRATFIC